MAEPGKTWAVGIDTAKITSPLYIEGSQTWYAYHHRPLNLSSSFSSEHFTLASCLQSDFTVGKKSRPRKYS